MFYFFTLGIGKGECGGWCFVFGGEKCIGSLLTGREGLVVEKIGRVDEHVECLIFWSVSKIDGRAIAVGGGASEVGALAAVKNVGATTNDRVNVLAVFSVGDNKCDIYTGCRVTSEFVKASGAIVEDVLEFLAKGLPVAVFDGEVTGIGDAVAHKLKSNLGVLNVPEITV